MNPNLQSRIADFTAAFGAFVTFIISLTHHAIRPHIVNFVRGVRALGVGAGRLGRQLFDRHLVAFILRPVLSFSLAAVIVALVLGAYAIIRIDAPLGEAGLWLAAIALVIVGLGIIVRWQTVGVNGLTNGAIDALERDSPVLQARRQLFEQALTQHQAVVDLLQTQFQQRLVTHTQACLAAAQANPANPAYPPAPVMPALPNAPVLPDLVLTTAQETAHEDWLRRTVLARFGRPGLAPRVAATTLLLWASTGLWYVAVGVVLEHAEVSAALTSLFVGVGWVLVAVAMALWIAGAVISAETIRYGVGALVWGARLVLPPTIQVLPFWDVNNLNTILAPDLGIPSEQVARGIREAHEVPFAVLCAVAMLTTIEHGLVYLGFIGGLAVVLLFGWAFIRGMKQTVSEKVVHGIVVLLFILALVQLGLRVGGYSIVGFATACHAAAYDFAGANSYGMAGIVALLIGLVFFLVMVQYFITKNVDNSTMAMIMVGIVATIAVSGSLVMAHRIARENRVHGTVSGSSGSSEHGEPARPARSASSDVTDGYPPTVATGHRAGT